jgi:hypothetical protein
MLLQFSRANAKTELLKRIRALRKFLKDGEIFSLDLLSGHACPMALQCYAKAIEGPDGKRHIEDGDSVEFRCFSASQEVQYNGVYNRRKHNFDLLRACKSSGEMLDLLVKSLPENAGVIRIHVAGDFFNQNYFDAWLALAALKPNVLFYDYTKSIPYWIARKQAVANLPNFVLTASRGGRQDKLISRHRLRQAVVVNFETAREALKAGMPQEVGKTAQCLGLPVDHDDSHAANPNKDKQSFALLIHSTQPKGSNSGKALAANKGKGSYSRKKRG